MPDQNKDVYYLTNVQVNADGSITGDVTLPQEMLGEIQGKTHGVVSVGYSVGTDGLLATPFPLNSNKEETNDD